MNVFSDVTWMTVLGMSLLFVGSFVLWVYGTQKPKDGIPAPITDAPKVQHHLVQWFFLYGALTCFAGVGCLLTAAMMII